MLEDAEIQGLLVRLDAPRDGVVTLDVDPSHEVRLRGRSGRQPGRVSPKGTLERVRTR